jgi:ribosomal protein L16 Arg81 hydroxylase
MSAIEKLLAPLTPEAFLGEVWEQSPRLLRAPGRAWDEVLSPRDFDALLGFSGAKVRVVKRGSVPYGALSAASDGRAFLESIWFAYRDGATLSVQDVEAAWPGVAALCAALTEYFSAPVRANLYITPPESQAYGLHHDTQDVFAVQLLGRKRWRLYGSRVVLPLDDDTAGTPSTASGELREDLTLEPGDVLYVPRGVLHEVHAIDGPSAHLTLSMHVYRIMDLLTAAVHALAARDETLRRAIPPGLLRGERSAAAAEILDGLAGRLEQATSDEAVANLSRRLAREAVRPTAERFSALGESRPVHLDSALRHVDGVRCRVLEDGQRASIEFFGTVVRGPGRIAPALRFVADHPAFTPRQLPDSLDDSAKLVLARKLLSSGLLCHGAA